MPLTAMRLDFSLSKGREVSLLSVAQASLLTPALRGGLDRLLLIAVQSGEAAGEGVSNAELHGSHSRLLVINERVQYHPNVALNIQR